MTAPQPDVAGAVLALDQAMIALAVAKSTLLGEISRPVPLSSLRDREHYEDAPDGMDVPVFEPDEERQCEELHNLGFICTRTKGHRFNHAAIFSSGDVVYTWPLSHLQPPAPYGHQSLQPKEA